LPSIRENKSPRNVQTINKQAYSRAATDRQPYKMGVLKIEISLTRSNFAVHIFDFDILCILLGTTYMPNFEVPCTVV